MSERIEPAPARDERTPTPQEYLAARSALESCDWNDVPLGNKAVLGRVIDLLWHASRSAQPKQHPIGEIVAFGPYLSEMKWNTRDGEAPKVGTKVYAAPPQ